MSGSSFETPIQEQLAGENHRCTALVHFSFKTRQMHLWHGFGDLRSMGETWRGDAGLASITAVGAGISGIAEEMRFRIAATEEAMLLADQDAANEETVGRPVKVWLQFFDDRPGLEWQLLGTPKLWFWGTMGAPELVTEEADARGNRQSYVELTGTNTFALISRPPFSFWSKAEVRARSSDGGDQIADRMGEFLNGSVAWPRF